MDDSSSTKTATVDAPAPAKPKRKARPNPKPLGLPRFHVVLLDDDAHSYEYVVEMLGRVFRHEVPLAFRMACEVDETGRAIVFTGHKELAELKRDQVMDYGADPRIGGCQGSMTARLEQAT